MILYNLKVKVYFNSIMATSDSEDFESADEGHNSPVKKERKKRLSSNYSETALETEQIVQQIPVNTNHAIKHIEKEKNTDGWDDFDIEDDESDDFKRNITNEIEKKEQLSSITPENESMNMENKNTENVTGWDDFDNWEQEEMCKNEPPPPNSKKEAVQPDPEIEAVTGKLASSSTGSGWGWGWSVDSLLSTATAGITTLTTHVSQGISTVLETSIGAPDPEELAKQKVEHREKNRGVDKEIEANSKDDNEQIEEAKGNESDSFAFGSLISGVTKFVETTGTKVISGGLDTLETIGKKTMEVLQDGDPGLAKKRAMLGLNPGDKPVLSQVLREAKAKAEEEDKIREQKREAKEVHYENLFDDFEGLVHLEALEMLSRQVSMRIDERMRGLNPEKRQDIKETLQQVAELCEMPEEDEDDDDSTEHMSKPEAFLERLQTATQDLGLKLQFLPLTKQYTEVLDWLASTETEFTDKVVYKHAVSGLAQATALSVELYHKAGEMLLVKARRSTADEADALTQMTVVLTKHIGDMATLFTDKLNALTIDNKEQINNYITNIFLEAGNSSTYIQNAFQLTLPILQIGAV